MTNSHGTPNRQESPDAKRSEKCPTRWWHFFRKHVPGPVRQLPGWDEGYTCQRCGATVLTYREPLW